MLRLLRVPCTRPEHENLRIKIERGTKIQCLGCGGVFYTGNKAPRLRLNKDELLDFTMPITLPDAPVPPAHHWTWESSDSHDN